MRPASLSLCGAILFLTICHASGLDKEKPEPAGEIEADAEAADPADASKPGDLVPKEPTEEKVPVASSEKEAPSAESLEEEAKAEVHRALEVMQGAEKKMLEKAKSQRQAAKEAFQGAKAEREKQLESTKEHAIQGEQAFEEEETALAAELERVKAEALKAEEAFASEVERLEAAGAAKEKLDDVQKQREQTREAWGTQYEQTVKQQLSLPERKEQTHEAFRAIADGLRQEITQGVAEAAESEAKWDTEETRLVSDMDELKEEVFGDLRPKKSGWRAWLPWSASSLAQLESSKERKQEPMKEEASSGPEGMLIEARGEVSVDDLQQKLVEAQLKAKKAKDLVGRAKKVFKDEVKKVEDVTSQYLSVLRSTGLEAK